MCFLFSVVTADSRQKVRIVAPSAFHLDTGGFLLYNEEKGEYLW